MKLKNRRAMSLVSLIMLLNVLIVCGLSNKLCANPMQGPGPGAGGISNHGPHIFRPPVVPPGFPYKWYVKDAVESFRKNNLEIHVIDTAVGTLPAYSKKVMQFSIPSSGAGIGGCIIEFERKDNMDTVRKHFLKLNEKGQLYTWSYAKDNVLVVLSGAVSKEKAAQYEQALYEMKE